MGAVNRPNHSDKKKKKKEARLVNLRKTCLPSVVVHLSIWYIVIEKFDGSVQQQRISAKCVVIILHLLSPVADW